MDTLTAPLGKSARLRRWLARHLVAMLATVIVLGVLGLKNVSQYQPVIRLMGIDMLPKSRVFGWPKLCVHYDFGPIWTPADGGDFIWAKSSPYEIDSWPSLLIDALIAVVSVIATWVLFSRTQRRCDRWWQLSLASHFAFVLLAAVVCTVLKSESLWGW